MANVSGVAAQHFFRDSILSSIQTRCLRTQSIANLKTKVKLASLSLAGIDDDGEIAHRHLDEVLRAVARGGIEE
jgi:hypothetical protein